MSKWWSATRPGALPSFWAIPGFGIEFVKADWMHVVCLGVLQLASGSAMWDIYTSLGGTLSSSKGHCDRLFSMIRTMARDMDLDCPIGDLSVPMFKKSATKPAKLKLKAAEGRRFLVVLRKLLEVAFPLDTPYRSARFSCIDNLYLCYRELDHWIDGGTSTTNLARYGMRYLLLYMDLGRLAGDDCLWHITPKMHLFAHLVSNAVSNPKLTWNYYMESQIGDAAALAGTVNKLDLHRSVLKRRALME